jgi:hypothetical protein
MPFLLRKQNADLPFLSSLFHLLLARLVEFATLHLGPNGKVVFHPYKPEEIEQLLKDENVKALIEEKEKEMNQ